MGKVTCKYPGCPEPIRGRGWCNKHWQRWRKHGDPSIVLSSHRLTPEQRFWAKVNKNGPVPAAKPELGPCWAWKPAKAGGYGRFRASPERLTPAHRFAY